MSNTKINVPLVAKQILKRTLSLFFSAKIDLIEEDYTSQGKNNSTIFNNPISQLQRVFILNNDKILITPRLRPQEDNQSVFSILITKQGIGNKKTDFKIFNTIEETLSSHLTKAFNENFQNPIQLFDDNLLKMTIALYFCKGFYHPSKIVYLIDYINKLKTTSFEGEFFSTGMILTKSIQNFKRNKGQSHFGFTSSLVKPFNLVKSSIDRRFWYLADGKSHFFLCNRKLDVNSLFTLNRISIKNRNYLDDLLLNQSLYGSDALFRVENEKEISIVTSNNKEFIYSENHWKYRDYVVFKQLIIDKVELSDIVFNHLLFFILFCSKHRISSIIWIPNELTKINLLLKNKNRLTWNNIKIYDPLYKSLIIRLLSSDGATIIDRKGQIIYYGCIIDMASLKIKGVKGTGESAAGLLSENGISIKVSQDGTIKIFKIKNQKPILF